MEINAPDQLFRSEPNGSSPARRSPESTEKRFASLLDAHTARARVDRSAQRPVEAARREDERSAKPARAERPEPSERTERPAQDDRPRRVGKADRAERPSTGKADAAKADKIEKIEKELPADQADAAEPAQAADASVPSEVDKPVAAAPEGEAEVESEIVALPVAVDPLAELSAVTLDAPAPAAPVAVVVAPVVPVVDAPVAAATDEPAETKAAAAVAVPTMPADTADSDLAKLQTEAKPAKAAAPTQIALPTATLAETAKQAEPVTEDYADFMLRNAATAAPAAAAVADAGKEAVKAETDAKDAKEGKLIVTVAQPAAIAAPVAPVTAFAVQAVVSNDNVALDAALPAKSVLDGDDVKVAAKTAEPTNLFAQNLEAARGTQGSEAPKSAARTPLVPPHEQVAVHIRKAVADGLDQISIRLNPAELGRIDIKLDLRADGTLRAAFAADRQATLELLKNDSRQLENALSDAGLRADAGGLNFSLRGDNRENAQAFRDMGSQYANRRDANENVETPAQAVATGYARQRAGNGRLDLNA